MEADTVAHCGDSIVGRFAWSLTVTDIFTGWTENRAMWNKECGRVYEKISDIERIMPFEILGFDCDNGGEFINHALHDYFTKREKPVQFTRSRPYKKNDNAHVEQKNWTHVRNLFGYDRLDNKKTVVLMDDLYRNEWSLLQNHFMPSMKLKCKERIGAKYKKKYEIAKTPYERVLESNFVADTTKEQLMSIHATINPFTLKEKIENKLAEIFRLIKVASHLRQFVILSILIGLLLSWMNVTMVSLSKHNYVRRVAIWVWWRSFACHCCHKLIYLSQQTANIREYLKWEPKIFNKKVSEKERIVKPLKGYALYMKI